jgi:hypothetical protein
MPRPAHCSTPPARRSLPATTSWSWPAGPLLVWSRPWCGFTGSQVDPDKAEPPRAPTVADQPPTTATTAWMASHRLLDQARQQLHSHDRDDATTGLADWPAALPARPADHRPATRALNALAAGCRSRPRPGRAHRPGPSPRCCSPCACPRWEPTATVATRRTSSAGPVDAPVPSGWVGNQTRDGTGGSTPPFLGAQGFQDARAWFRNVHLVGRGLCGRLAPEGA